MIVGVKLLCSFGERPLSLALGCVGLNRIRLFSQARSVDILLPMSVTRRSIIRYCGFRVINETYIVEFESDVMNSKSKSACESPLSWKNKNSF
jgi:hypothetical protein